MVDLSQITLLVRNNFELSAKSLMVSLDKLLDLLLF